MQTGSSRFWTRVIVSILYNDIINAVLYMYERTELSNEFDADFYNILIQPGKYFTKLSLTLCNLS